MPTVSKPLGAAGVARRFHSVVDQSAIVDTDVTVTSPAAQYLEELRQWSMLGDYRRCLKLASLAPEQTTAQSREAQTIILKAHVNALTLRDQHVKSFAPLVRASDVVTSFVNVFPTDPTPLQWRLRLVFLQKAHFLTAKEFPVKLLIEHIAVQQASGVPVEAWDVEMVVTTIVYSKQFAVVTSASQWERQCNQKLQLIMQVHDIAFRSTGEKLCLSESLLALLYRLCFSPRPNECISPSEAIKDPEPSPTKGPRAFVDNRASSIFNLFGGEGGAPLTKPMLILVMAVLVNGALWPKFWSLWNLANKNDMLDTELVAIMASMVSKSADQRNMTYMLERALPEVIASTGMSPDCVKVVNKSLDYLDPEGLAYKSLRSFISQPRS